MYDAELMGLMNSTAGSAGRSASKALTVGTLTAPFWVAVLGDETMTVMVGKCKL